MKRGDIIGLTGVPVRSKSGELSIRPNSIVQLSYSLHMLPVESEHEQLNKDTRYRFRYMDLILHNNVKKIFKTRN
jgi:lysyl-tRNA synthetase class 2